MALEYEQDVRIDTQALDVEWLYQPQLMREYSQHQADCRKELDRAKEELLVVDAQVAKEVRKNPDKYGLEKTTVAEVHEAVIQSSKHRAIMNKVIDAQHEYSSAQAAVTAIEHKKTALENLGRLLGLQYFAGPKVPRDLDTEERKRQSRKISNAAVSIGQRKKKQETEEAPKKKKKRRRH